MTNASLEINNYILYMSISDCQKVHLIEMLHFKKTDPHKEVGTSYKQVKQRYFVISISLSLDVHVYTKWLLAVLAIALG